MSCTVVGGNNGLGDVLWLLDDAKNESDITFFGIPRTVELIEVVRDLTTVDIRNIITLSDPAACVDAPGIPDYQLWLQKWYTSQGGKEYFFDYKYHGRFGSAPLKKPRAPQGYIVSQLYSHRQPHHFWPPTLDALNESGRMVYTVTMNDQEPSSGTRFHGSIREVAELILGANLFVGLASGITGLAVFLGVPTIMAAATREDMLSIPDHMEYLVQPSKEEILRRINARA